MLRFDFIYGRENYESKSKGPKNQEKKSNDWIVNF